MASRPSELNGFINEAAGSLKMESARSDHATCTSSPDKSKVKCSSDGQDDSLTSSPRKRKCRPANSGSKDIEKRRETNRNSARRCRKRRKEELKLLEEEIRRLNAETEELTAEKAQLRQELDELMLQSQLGHSFNQFQDHSQMMMDQHIARRGTIFEPFATRLQPPGYSPHVFVQGRPLIPHPRLMHASTVGYLADIGTNSEYPTGSSGLVTSSGYPFARQNNLHPHMPPAL